MKSLKTTIAFCLNKSNNNNKNKKTKTKTVN